MWTSSKPLSAGVIVWMALSVLIGPLVVVALGYLVGAIPDAVNAGLGSPAGHRLIATLIVAAVICTVSLLTDPAGGALGTVVRQRTTGWLQARLMGAVTGPAGMTHLEPVPANAPRQRHSGNPLPADPGPRAVPRTQPRTGATVPGAGNPAGARHPPGCGRPRRSAERDRVRCRTGCF